MTRCVHCRARNAEQAVHCHYCKEPLRGQRRQGGRLAQEATWIHDRSSMETPATEAHGELGGGRYRDRE